VEQFAGDIWQHLQWRPVVARRDTWGYRGRVFLKRHPYGVTAAALVVLLLGGFSLSTRLQLARVQIERDRSENVSSFLISLFQSSDPAGQPDDALDARAVLSRGLVRIDELAGQPELQARLLDALGNVLVSLDDLEEGRALLERSLALRRETLGDSHPEVLATLRALARAYRYLGQFPRALAVAEEALALQRRAGAPADTFAVSPAEVAFMLPFVGRTWAADTVYSEVVELLRQQHSSDDPRVAEALRRLGSVRRRIGLLAAAESSYREALDINTRLLGPDDRATVLAQIAIADLAAFDYPAAGDAEQLYRDAIATLERVRGPQHIDLEHPLDNLAELMLARGEAREAERIWRRLLEIRVRHFGAEHRASLFSEQGVGRALYRQGRRREGEATMRSTLDRHIRLLGAEHPFVATAIQSIAEALEKGGEYRVAEELMRRAIVIRRRTFGDRGLEVVWSESMLAGLLIHRGEYNEARQLLENAITVQLERTTPTHRETRLTYKRLANLHARMGDTAKQRQYTALAGDVR
jgi:serine/threonine-protein kinase